MKSSKDVARKSGQPNNQSRPAAPNRAPQPGPVGKTGRPASTPARAAGQRPGTQVRTSAQAAQTRPGTQARSQGRTTAQVRPGAPRRTVQKKGGFRLRPVDMIIGGVAVVIVGLIVWALWQSAPAAQPSGSVDTSRLLAAGTQAPDFSLPGSDGETYSLSQFKGTPVVLEFMAPWCPHCQEDSVVFNKVYNDYKAKGIAMLGINASPYGKDYSQTARPVITMEDQKWFATNFQVPYPMLFDAPVEGANGLDLKQREAYGIDYFPTVYVVDKEGKVSSGIVADVDNPMTYERVAGEVEKVLK